MKKAIAILCCCCIMLIFCLPMSATAHPGRTDGKGGHTNRSTGEYHYHHGYSAHDHWDMDGDGDVDCPYNHEDKTNHNSGSNNIAVGTHTQSESRENVSQKNKENDRSFAHTAIVFVVVFFVLVNCLAIFIDKTDKSNQDELISIPSAILSVLSTLMVFAVLFSILFAFNQPLALRSISLKEMIEVLFLSVPISGLVWTATNWLSLIVNTFLCSLFNTEVHGWAGSFQRLTMPLSYALTVIFFLLK